MKKSTAFERWNNYIREQNEKAQKDHEEELLPCPFCGGEAEIFDYDPEKEVGFHEPYTVQCSNECCCLGKDFRTREEAAEAWNRRAQQKQPNEPLTLEELRAMDGEPVWLHTFSRYKKRLISHSGRY